MATVFSVSGNWNGEEKSALNLAIRSWLSWIRGPVSIKTRDLGSYLFKQHQVIYRTRNVVIPMSLALRIAIRLWFSSALWRIFWYGRTGISFPSFCGHPMICQKQHCPCVRMSSCLCCSLSNIQKGFWDIRKSDKNSDFLFPLDWTSFWSSLNVNSCNSW